MPPAPIALVITELAVGGAERALTHLAIGLDRSRFRPVVYSLGPPPRDEQGELVAALERAQVEMHFLNARQVLHFPRTFGRLRRHFEAQAPRIVQTFLFHANVTGTLAARALPEAAVVTGFRVADPRRWRQRIERRIDRHAQRIVCVSRDVADYCRDRVRLPAEKLIVIPNGVELDRYAEARPCDLKRLGVPEGRRVLTSIGRLDPQKGLDWLLPVVPELLRPLPDHDLLLVGEGPQRRELERLVSRTSFRERVHFAGWRPDIPAILQSSDALLLPSRWEGMPNVLLEAMASGRPVIATRVTGVLEVLGPLAEEQTVEPGDASGFAQRVQAIVGDRRCAERLGYENRQRAALEFSVDRMIGRFEQLYETLLAS